MLWSRIKAPGFPTYVTGWFDDQTGRSAPPSFYLNLNGRSCAYEYSGLDILIDPESNYRISASIRPHKLSYARAYITAFFVDARSKPRCVCSSTGRPW